MSDFVVGFTTRNEGVAQALQAAFAITPQGFAPADLLDRVTGGPTSYAPRAGEPKHFHPADPASNPTAGWDPFTATADASPGFADPVSAAHARGYAEGRVAGLTEAGDEVGRDAALLTQLAEALRADDRLDRADLARRLRQTVLYLVTKLVGESGIAPDLLAGRIEAATAILADSAESAMLRVHPDDVALLEGKLPKTVFAVGDASVARGGFVLESASTIVEDGPHLWLEQLAQAIDRVALPQG
jgi:flagellar assembly protein FliH